LDQVTGEEQLTLYLISHLYPGMRDGWALKSILPSIRKQANGVRVLVELLLEGVMVFQEGELVVTKRAGRSARISIPGVARLFLNFFCLGS
jgi:hypothetical protein